MSNTLQVVESIQRTGYTIIDGIKVVQHTCTISSENPEQMRVGMIKLNTDMYKSNRATCRDDFAVFEDSAYELQESLITKLKTESEVVEGENAEE